MGYDAAAEDKDGVRHLAYVRRTDYDKPPEAMFRCTGTYQLIEPWKVHLDKVYTCLLCIEAGE